MITKLLLLFYPLMAFSSWELDSQGLGVLSLVGAGKAPPAALVRFEHQKLSDKAYALGCGHCNGLPVGDYVFDKYLPEVDGKPYNVYLNDSGGKQHGIAIEKVIFGTQTKVDLVLVQLKLTYKQLAKRYGMTSWILEKKYQNVGTELAFYVPGMRNPFTGVTKSLTQYCHIDGAEKIYHFDNSGNDYIENTYVYNDCISKPGDSGAVLVSRDYKRIFGLNVSGSYPVLRNGVYVSRGSEVSVLYSCLNKQYQFDIKVPGCRLR